MKQNDIYLYPFPRKLIRKTGEFLFPRQLDIVLLEKEKNSLLPGLEMLKEKIEKSTISSVEIVFNRPSANQAVHCIPASGIPSQGYELRVEKEKIELRFSDPAGGFYGMQTLIQLIHWHAPSLPALIIEDTPDFERRGIMLDISRDKIPRLESIKKLIRLFASLKVNELQLYIEGFSYYYPSHPQVALGRTPLTAHDIMELDRYCRQYFIDLVPNQNCFGHMSQWLAHPDYAHLAEIDETDFEVFGEKFSAATLNPLDPRSLELVKSMTDDLLPAFSSSFFNMGCDETRELGLGKSREECEKIGKGRVYLDYLLKLCRIAKERNKRPMIWGDIISNHPELISELPSDLIVMDWGYDAETRFDKNLPSFLESGLDFYVCPGTSSWVTVTGKHDNMMVNVENAVRCGIKYGARGILMTDWGDRGHWQYQLFSYPSFAYAAALSWNYQANREISFDYFLDTMVFQDSEQKMTECIRHLNNYYLLDPRRVHYMTVLFTILQDEEIKLPGKGWFDRMLRYLQEGEEMLRRTRLQASDARLLQKEVLNAVRILRYAVYRGLSLKTGSQSAEDKRKMYELLVQFLSEHRDLWNARNRWDNYEHSIRPLMKQKKNLDGGKVLFGP